ncbi:transcriptional regulator, TetR family [Caulobacter sp. UNC279MFTsu5.1]|nr:transcriptional regulator, TetR family [Caulobacter sp. UNC279MFTsu5.1]
MARPMEFDRDEAIGKAIAVFADHGYEGSSTAELLARMGIGRQSLYGAFGDKKRLFLQALERYNAGSLAQTEAALAVEDSPRAAIEAALLAFAVGPDVTPEAGCLGVGSIAEFGRSDPDVNAINDAAGRRFKAAFAARLADGVAAGQFAPDLDPEAGAEFLLTVRAGLKVAARDGAGLDRLRSAARLALRGLDV